MNKSTFLTSKGLSLAISAFLFVISTATFANNHNAFENPVRFTKPDNLIPTITAPNGAFFCEGGSTVLISSVADSYQWYRNNQLIVGETSQTFTATIGGIYKVAVSYGEGSTGTSAGILVRQGNFWTGGASDNDWNNTANWSCGELPLPTDHIVVDETTGTHPVVASGSLVKIYSLSLTESAVLEVEGGGTLEVTDAISVHPDAELILRDEASLVQINDVNNTGNVISQKNTAPMKRYDFTYWSSPVAGQTLYNLSPGTLSDKFYSFSPIIGNWVAHLNGTQTMEEGKGYIVRAPQFFSVTVATAYETQFVGTPNNGTVNVPIAIGNSDMNLLGNPYPSAIDLDAFLSHPANAALTDGTVYLWTHNSAPSSATPGDNAYNYTSNDYAAYNLLGGTATATSGNNETPTGRLASGQSFFIKGLSAGQAVFENSMRVAFSNDQFFRTSEADKHRIWLNLTNDQGAFKQTLIGYIDGATDGVDRNFDGIDALNGNAFVNLYSISNDKHFTIQGRALPFDENASLPLGYSTTAAGSFAIGLGNFDGLFATQSIYLYDHQTETLQDLKSGDYAFTTAIGTFNNRFELRFTNGLLGVESFTADHVIVAATQNRISILSTENMASVEVFDLSGRRIYANRLDAKETTIELHRGASVLLVKVQMQNGKTLTKKIVSE